MRLVTATLITLFLFTAAAALGDTVYISTSGNNSTADGTAALPYQTLTAAFARGGGHTYVLQDGTYDYTGMEITTPPSGTAGAYTVIKAEHDGAVVIKRALSLANTTSYVRFEGLRWDYPGEKIVLGHHHKFFRCGFRAGPSSGNVKNTRVGQDNYPASDVLFEDCWFWGPGGRYNIQVYHSQRVVLRRCVIRHDGGWTGPLNPEAGVTFYNSHHVAAQNVIVLDSLGTYLDWDRAFFLVRNPGSVGYAVSDVSYRGCIALATHGLGLAMDTDGQTISNIVVDNCVFWDTRNGGIGMNEGNKVNVSITNVTIGSSQQTHQASAGGISYWDGGPDNPTVKNVIIKGKKKPFYALAPTYFDCHGNTEACPSGTGARTYDPLTNGLMHLRQIESGTPLATDGESGGRIGAQILTRVGVSGTLYGETGWESDTGEALWPWPHETRIKNEMCVGRTDGFCGAASLTTYICNYLGNSCSSDTQAPTAPPSPGAVAETPGSIRVSWSASADNVGVTGYRLDVSANSGFTSYVPGYQNKDAGSVITTTATGLSPSTTYYARVRAYDAAANISANSATVSATTSASGGTTTRVIDAGAIWRYLKGTAAAPASWNGISFDDSAWLSGPTGIGYADGDDATVLSDMQNNYLSVYARKTFNVASPAGVTGLTLIIDYDDGYVAYLNGAEVARANMPAGAPAYNTGATPFHEAGTPVTVDLSSSTGLLVSGQNVLAIEIHNDELPSSDLTLIPKLDIQTNGDVFAPSAPSNAAATATIPTEMTVTWSAATDNVAVTGYRLDVSTSSSFSSYVSGQQNRDAGNVTSALVTGLGGGTTYYARARAYDAAANVSANSNTANVTTPASEPPTTVRVIAAGDSWKYWKGTAAPPAGWSTASFNDAAWLSGPTGIGYGDADDATVLTDMLNGYWSVYARRSFNVANAAAVAGMTLILDYDDGYVAYLNGTEVARANMPAGAAAYNTAATPNHEAGTPVTVDLSAFRTLLVTGANVLSIEIHNDTINSSDLSLIPILDLRIPVRVIAVGDSWKYFKGTAAPSAGWNGASFNDSAWLSGPTGIGYADGDDATLLSDMQNNYVSVYGRRFFTINNPANVTRLTMAIDYDDGYVAYLNGTEVARASMPAGTPAYNTVSATFHEAGTPVTVDLTAFIGLLSAGQNVLAVEVHNDSLSSSDLSMIPTLDVER